LDCDSNYQHGVSSLPIPINSAVRPDQTFSPTSIRTFLECPYKWYLRYVEKRKEPETSNPAFIEGKALHKALELTIKFPDQDMTSEVALALSPIPEKTRGRAFDFVELFKEEHLHDFRGGRSEFPIEVELGGARMQGIVDYADESRVVDFKYVAKKLSPKEVATNIQFGVYSAALNQPNVQAYCFIKEKGIIQVVTATRSPEAQEHIKSIIGGVVNAVEKRLFPKVEPNAWVCKKAWCSMWDYCEQGGAR